MVFTGDCILGILVFRKCSVVLLQAYLALSVHTPRPGGPAAPWPSVFPQGYWSPLSPSVQTLVLSGGGGGARVLAPRSTLTGSQQPPQSPGLPNISCDRFHCKHVSLGSDLSLPRSSWSCFQASSLSPAFALQARG